MQLDRWAGGTCRTDDVSADGQRFLILKDAGDNSPGSPPALLVVVNRLQDVLATLPATR